VSTFVDTSGLYAVLSADDSNHDLAAQWFRDRANESSDSLKTHNYVVVKTAALVQRRLGPQGLRDLIDGLLLPLRVLCVEEELHRRATSALLAGIRRRVSLVDWVSFEMMRESGIEEAFAFDRDFEAQAFRTVP
jgi:predicted nucleic acid-binding protein